MNNRKKIENYIALKQYQKIKKIMDKYGIDNSIELELVLKEKGNKNERDGTL